MRRDDSPLVRLASFVRIVFAAGGVCSLIAPIVLLAAETISDHSRPVVMPAASQQGFRPTSWRAKVASVAASGALLPQAIAADFNRDGTVNYADFFLFADRFGTLQADTGYKPAYDLNGNGQIEFADFSLFADSFGLCPEDIITAKLADSDALQRRQGLEGLAEYVDQQGLDRLFVHLGIESVEENRALLLSIVEWKGTEQDSVIAVNLERLLYQPRWYAPGQATPWDVLHQYRDTHIVDTLVSFLRRGGEAYPELLSVLRDYGPVAADRLVEDFNSESYSRYVSGQGNEFWYDVMGALISLWPDSMDPLAAALHDNDAGRRMGAVMALGYIREEGSVKGLLYALHYDSDAEIRRTAQQELNSLKVLVGFDYTGELGTFGWVLGGIPFGYMFEVTMFEFPYRPLVVMRDQRMTLDRITGILAVDDVPIDSGTEQYAATIGRMIDIIETEYAEHDFWTEMETAFFEKVIAELRCYLPSTGG